MKFYVVMVTRGVRFCFNKIEKKKKKEKRMENVGKNLDAS